MFMKNLATLMVILSFSVPLLASEQPRVGRSSLKLEQGEAAGGIREKRKALESVEKEIALLDQEIQRNRSQVITWRGQRLSEQQTATQEALLSVYELQKSDLVAKRDQLQADLSAKN